jgi:Asp-tRNA(Asn)/Glu-tRNA(Gln) amidotransferase C subunit
MNAHKLRNWLLQHPKPALIKLHLEDGEEKTLKPNLKSFMKTAETIAALDPELIEALDAEGGVIRAVRPDSPEARRSDAAEVPAVLAQDPHAAMLTHCANLIHRAYEHSTETAFQKLVDVLERMNERSDAIERRLERSEATGRRLQQELIDDAYDRAEELAERALEQAQQDGGGDMKQMLTQAFLSGQMNGGARGRAAGTNNGAPANGASNGAPKGKA